MNAVANNQTRMARHGEPNNTGVTGRTQMGADNGGLKASNTFIDSMVIPFPTRCAEKSEVTVNIHRKHRVKIHQFTPMDDRKAIARAFYTLGRSVRWLARMADRSESTIEEILRSAHDEQVGVLRHALKVNTAPRPSGPVLPTRRAA